MAVARYPPTRPVSELALQDDIHFYHPGYAEEATARLLSLPRVDSTMSADAAPIYGVHHGTALLACQIIAGNVFTNSYLALDKAGQQEVRSSVDILTDEQYYFIVRGSGKCSLLF